MYNFGVYIISSVLYESLLHSTVAIFELFPSTSNVNEANGPASVFVRLAAGSGELTFDIAVTIETISGGSATGEFIGKLATSLTSLTIFYFFL